MDRKISLRPAASCLLSEELELPFTRGTGGAASVYTYSGRVEITASGAGQSAGSAYSDAFYLFTDGSGAPIPPEHPDDWILTINSKPAVLWITEGRLPVYNADHVYSFEITAPGGVLVFGIDDGFAGDNTGSLSITICQC